MSQLICRLHFSISTLILFLCASLMVCIDSQLKADNREWNRDFLNQRGNCGMSAGPRISIAADLDPPNYVTILIKLLDNLIVFRNILNEEFICRNSKIFDFEILPQWSGLESGSAVTQYNVFPMLILNFELYSFDVGPVLTCEFSKYSKFKIVDQ